MPVAEAKDLLRIAKVLKSDGSKGNVILGFLGIESEDIDTKGPVFIFFDGLPVPFFFNSFVIKGRKAYVSFNDMTSLEDAEEIVGKEVFAERNTIRGTIEDKETLDFSGWTVLDKEGIPVGVISGVEEIPGNPCFYINTENGEKMLPIHDDFIISMNEDNHILQMNIPDGLLA